MSSSDQAVRRKAMQRVIELHYAGNVSAFARKAKKPQSQIADMLASRKKFGEKVARAIEKAAGLEKGLLDRLPDTSNGNAVQEPLSDYGSPLTIEERSLLEDYAAIDEELAKPIRALIQRLAEQANGDKPAPGKVRDKSKKSRETAMTEIP